MNLKTGDKITVFEINWVAMTQKNEWQITGEMSGKLTAKPKGKRKEYYLTFSDEKMVFAGWDLPLKIDGDITTISNGMTCTTRRGNACYNLTGMEPDAMRAYIESNQLNELFSKRGHIVHVDGEKENVLYPDEETSHAVIDRIKAKAN